MPEPAAAPATRRATLTTLAALGLGWCGAVPRAGGQTLRERLRARQDADALDAEDGPSTVVLPAGVLRDRDIAYGTDAAQTVDVYRPARGGPSLAPLLLMVHGGGWRRGDKAMASVVAHKVARWVPRGIVVVSVNYRMLPGTAPLAQSGDVARALATVQAKAATWGADASSAVLMGHSAGAHLVALLAADPAPAIALGARPWLGTVALDSAALDVVKIMQSRHVRLYDAAFGSDAAQWPLASPLQRLAGRPAPFLSVCSSRRSDSCAQAHAFVDALHARGARADVLAQDASHREINDRLGLPGPYTDAVEAFLASLDARWQHALAAR